MDKEKIRPQDKWDEKAGIVARTYKIDKATSEAFKETCNRLKLGQGPTITRLMNEFIREHQE